MVELFCDDGYSEKLSDEVCIDYWYNKADVSNFTETHFSSKFFSATFFQLPTKDFWTGIVNETTVVEVNVSVKDFPMVDDMTKTMTLQLNVETAWTDRRLDVNFTHFPGNKFDIESEAYANLRSVISLDKVGMLWQPDLVIEKLVNFKILSVLEPLRGLLVDPYYRVTHNVLCTVTVSCSMDFDNFPLDTQLCDFAVNIFIIEAIKVIASTNIFLLACKRELCFRRNEVYIDVHEPVEQKRAWREIQADPAKIARTGRRLELHIRQLHVW